MSYSLCIAEKPSVAKDIATVIGAKNRKDGYFEGDGYIVTWAVGHLVGLAEPTAYGFVPQSKIYSEEREKAYDELPIIPKEFKLIVLEPTKAQFKIVKELINRDDVGLIIDCGDMGEEGHILQWFIREKAGCKKPVKRFCATSMTEEAIKKAMSNLRPIEDFKNIIKGEYCKKKADWILGMSMSRTISLKYNAGINVGRVQSPTLYFVVKRYLDVVNFKVTNYYTMDAELEEGFHVFWNKDTEGKLPISAKDSEGRVVDKPVIDTKVKEILASKKGTVTDLTIQKKGKERPQLYDITELQREANRKYGYTAALTLATAQALYETQKVLSYPRTDSRYITSDLQPYMEDRIRAIGTIKKFSEVAAYLLNEGLNIDKRIVDDVKVTDHHAIIPTEKIESFDLTKLEPTLEEKKKGVTAQTLIDILNLVLCRMMVAFSKPYYYEQTAVTVSFANGLSFMANGNKPLSMGWKKVQEALSGKEGIEDEDNSEGQEQIFPNISKGQTVTVKGCVNVPKKTTPPKLHTEATLLTAMENAGAAIENGAILRGKGIGTQATRAEIIKKLFDTGVAEAVKKGKTNYIQPTAKGLNVISILPEELYSPKITADWETKISHIADGSSNEDEFMRHFNSFIKDKVHEVKNMDSNISFKKEREVFGLCPWCNENVYRYLRKDERGKVEGTSYYCSQKCGFSIDTANKIFISRIGRNLTDSEIKKLIANRVILLECKKKDGSGTYKGEFKLISKEGTDGKRYCNVLCEPVMKKNNK